MASDTTELLKQMSDIVGILNARGYFARADYLRAAIELLKSIDELTAHCTTYRAERDVALDDVKRLREAGEALVRKLDEVEEATIGVFHFYQIHGQKYTGPTYADEIRALRALVMPQFNFMDALKKSVAEAEAKNAKETSDAD